MAAPIASAETLTRPAALVVSAPTALALAEAEPREAEADLDIAVTLSGFEVPLAAGPAEIGMGAGAALTSATWSLGAGTLIVLDAATPASSPTPPEPEPEAAESEAAEPEAEAEAEAEASSMYGRPTRQRLESSSSNESLGRPATEATQDMQVDTSARLAVWCQLTRGMGAFQSRETAWANSSQPATDHSPPLITDHSSLITHTLRSLASFTRAHSRSLLTLQIWIQSEASAISPEVAESHSDANLTYVAHLSTHPVGTRLA